jgi:hypothetical protein
MSGIPGHLTSKNGPKAETAVLDVVQEKIYSYISMESTVVLYLLPGSAQHESLGQNNPRGNSPMASLGERNPRRVPDPTSQIPRASLYLSPVGTCPPISSPSHRRTTSRSSTPRIPFRDTCARDSACNAWGCSWRDSKSMCTRETYPCSC